MANDDLVSPLRAFVGPDLNADWTLYSLRTVKVYFRLTWELLGRDTVRVSFLGAL